ncbi:hypothetical protein BKA93DRAFT_827183 [Sparassis latifolia]
MARHGRKSGHLTATRKKPGRPPEQPAELGPDPKLTHLLLKLPPHLPPSHPPVQSLIENYISPSSSSSNEDVLYGAQVTQDDNDDGVVHNSETDGDDITVTEPASQSTQGDHGKVITPLHAQPVEVEYMVPKHDGKAMKRVPLSSAMTWDIVRERLRIVMGYDNVDDMALSYRLSKDAKSVRKSLEDDNDYQGIVQSMQSHRRNTRPQQVIILDDSVNDSEQELSQPKGSHKKAPGMKAAAVAHAYATVEHQSQIDEVVEELKRQNPKCSEHAMSCWLGHPSGEHVQLTEMRFAAWATDIVKQLSLPEMERTVTYTHPPNNRMFDVPLSFRHQHAPSVSKAPSTSMPVPPIIINMPEMSGSHKHLIVSPSSSDPVNPADAPWPSLTDFLLHAVTVDRHSRNYPAYEPGLRQADLLGPDDIEKCTEEELKKHCDIPIGAGRFLIHEAKLVCKQIRQQAQIPQKRFRFD